MASGFWNGVVWGTFVSVAGAVTVSLLSDVPEQAANLPEVPVAQIEADPAPEIVPEPARSEDPMGEDLPAPIVIETDDGTGNGGDDQTDLMDDPAPEAEGAPEAPEVAEAPEQPDTAPDTEEAPAPEVTADSQPDGAAPAQPDVADAEPALESGTLPAPTPDAADADPEMASADADPEALPEPAAPEAAPDRTDAAPIVSDVAPELPPVQPETIDLDEAPEPGLPEPAGNLIDARRATEAETTPTLQDNILPLSVYSTEFDNPSNQPLMSIVLIDTPGTALGPQVLRDFPYPITIAIDALAPDALQRMQAYRDAGFETLATANFPQGAGPTDAEVALGAIFNAVPEAIGFLEADDASLQQSRELTDQVTAVLADSGYGLVLQPKGLNTAQKVAVQEGVPAASIFRDLDGKDQNADVIRRFLDNAAFRARQAEEGVVVLTRLRPETISALLIWALQDRASQVALAPVSAVLKKSVTE